MQTANCKMQKCKLQKCKNAKCKNVNQHLRFASAHKRFEEADLTETVLSLLQNWVTDLQNELLCYKTLHGTTTRWSSGRLLEDKHEQMGYDRNYW